MAGSKRLRPQFIPVECSVVSAEILETTPPKVSVRMLFNSGAEQDFLLPVDDARTLAITILNALGPKDYVQRCFCSVDVIMSKGCQCGGS